MAQNGTTPRTVYLRPWSGGYRLVAALAVLGALVGMPFFLMVDPGSPAQLWTAVILALIPLAGFGPFALYYYLHSRPAYAYVAVNRAGFTVVRPLRRPRRYTWDAVTGFGAIPVNLPFLKHGPPCFELPDESLGYLPYVEGLSSPAVAQLMNRMRRDRRVIAPDSSAT